MPIYELSDTGLVPFQRLNPGPDLYESEIEALVWDDLEAFTGMVLFPVARQPKISAGGIPDVLALDKSGCVVIIEVKRDIDRGQLAQCLEYAGWARTTSLDEIASLYNRNSDGHAGQQAFFSDWQEFTETSTPVVISGSPSLVLIARDFHGRTRSALEFLQQNSVPVTVIPVTLYQDDLGRKIVDIDADHEPAAPVASALAPSTTAKAPYKTKDASGRRVTVKDLIDIGSLTANEPVEFRRPKLGEVHHATILLDGRFQLADGTIWNSPSRAAVVAADVVAQDGWESWLVVRTGKKLHQHREEAVDASFVDAS